MTKYPVLMVGIIFMSIFLMRYGDRVFPSIPRQQLSSCGVFVKELEKKKLVGWKLSCEDKNLTIEIQTDIFKNEKLDQLKIDMVRRLMYRELANHIIYVAQNGHFMSLQNIPLVRINLLSPKLDIEAYAPGKGLIQFTTLQKKEFILDHLKRTVQVKETIK